MGDDVDSDLEEIGELSTSPGGSRMRQHSLAASGVNDLCAEDDRRAHHNALERKRRDHIKDSFSTLKEVVPTLKGEKASRALILKKGAEYINSMKGRINEHNKDIMELKRQNSLLEAQVKIIESRLDHTGTARPTVYAPPVGQVSAPQISAPNRETSTTGASEASVEPETKRVKSTTS